MTDETEQGAAEEYPEYGMDCYVCGTSVATERGDVDMPEGWGFVHVAGYCLDGRPGLEPMYACPKCKDKNEN